MVKDQIVAALKNVTQDLGFEALSELTLAISSNPKFGDYSTNLPLQLIAQDQSKQETVRGTAEKLVAGITNNKSVMQYLEKVEIAGAGFVNFFVNTKTLLAEMGAQVPKTANPKKILVEYAQPNTHKAFHIGHLRNITLGESIARMLEENGNEVFRATYGSDIGLPVAKALWGVKQLQEKYLEVQKKSLRERAEFLGVAYAKGATEYEVDLEVKKQIDELNKQIYQRDTTLMGLWQETRQWSLDYFDSIYQRLGTKFDREFSESEIDKVGKEIVERNIGKVFVKEQGAIIFPGEKYAHLPGGQGLHNRVFITSTGNPTYEAKEIGLTLAEKNAFPFDESLHVVGSEQLGYFQVVIRAIEMLKSEVDAKKIHLSYGFVNLKSGKMSSRTGQVVTADWLLDEIHTKIEEIMKESKMELKDRVVEQVTVGAVKFAMLKFAPMTSFDFDINESVSLQGDSGPYVQYTFARTQSILKSAPPISKTNYEEGLSLEPEERMILTRLNHFPIIFEQAVFGYKPNILTEYLLNLTREFNLFYQKHRVIGSDKAEFRLELTRATGEMIKKGLYLLGIEAPERM